jgi:hypothetical protein
MVHETHIQYNRLPPLTPLAQLARMKSDKDEQERDDFWRRQAEAGQEKLQRELAAVP